MIDKPKLISLAHELNHNGALRRPCKSTEALETAFYKTQAQNWNLSLLYKMILRLFHAMKRSNQFVLLSQNNAHYCCEKKKLNRIAFLVRK